MLHSQPTQEQPTHPRTGIRSHPPSSSIIISSGNTVLGKHKPRLEMERTGITLDWHWDKPFCPVQIYQPGGLLHGLGTVFALVTAARKICTFSSLTYCQQAPEAWPPQTLQVKQIPIPSRKLDILDEAVEANRCSFPHSRAIAMCIRHKLCSAWHKRKAQEPHLGCAACPMPVI